VGAARFADGSVLLLGALGTDARVELAGNELRGSRDDVQGDLDWFVSYGDEATVFGAYAGALAARLGAAPGRPSPRVWCSWYSLYTGITERALAAILPDLARLPVDVVQVDDGWQVAVGDWRANEKFPAGMADLAGRIRATGRAAGLWLAPLIAVKSSRVAREHPEWLLRDTRGRRVSAAFNWGEQLFAIDTTAPGALDWVCGVLRTVREWGFDYIKLDFLYGGALLGARHSGAPREAAYREALRAMRAAMGDAYFVACGAPVVPSLGLCDALRIGPDVAGSWESRRDERFLANPAIPSMRTAIRTTVHRLWLAPLVTLDPDVMYLADTGNELTAAQRELHQALAQVCGFLSTSDLPAWLGIADATPDSEARMRVERAFSHQAVRATGPYAYEVGNASYDFSPAMGLPGPRTLADRLLRLVLSWLGSRRMVLRIMAAAARRDAARRVRRLFG
jgi:alpha-galactosidase